jgi:CheY-like chemotaxis protein
MTDDRNLGYALGAAEFITKPVDWEELAAVLRRHEGEHGAGRALVVDDDPLAREMMRRALERAGWQVAEAENGRTALERLAATRPELIVLDLMMPEMDGFEFVIALRARPEWSRVPVLVVTAKSLSGQERARLEGHVARVLQKGSYTRDELLAQVRSLVGSRAGRAEAS